MSVRPKNLGQHFLNDLNIHQKCAGALTGVDYQDVLGNPDQVWVCLTQYLLQTKHTIHAIEVGCESVNYLNTNFPKLEPNLVFGDFLKIRFNKKIFQALWQSLETSLTIYHLKSCLKL